MAELKNARVEFLRIEAFGRTYDIARTATRLGTAPPDPRTGRCVGRQTTC